MPQANILRNLQTVKLPNCQRGRTFFGTLAEESVHFRSNGKFRIRPDYRGATKRSSTSYSGLCAKKKRPRKDIHLPRGLLIASHSTINPSNPLEPTAYVIPSSFVSNSYGVQHSHLPGHTPDSTSPPARRRVALQKRCIPRNVALKRETPELIPSMALKSSFLLLLDSHEA